MRSSQLRNFNSSSVDQLIREGIGMVYDWNHYMTEGGEFLGIYHYEKRRIYIYPNIKEKKEEDVTIVHEWLHAYETITLELDPASRFRDSQIDWWAYFHLRRNNMLAYYIRGFFPEFIIK